MDRIVNYENGLPDGVTTIYNVQGALIQIGSCKAGLEHGSWGFYSAEGVLEFTGQYEQGKPIGICYEFKRGKKKVYKQY